MMSLKSRLTVHLHAGVSMRQTVGTSLPANAKAASRRRASPGPLAFRADGRGRGPLDVGHAPQLAKIVQSLVLKEALDALEDLEGGAGIAEGCCAHLDGRSARHDKLDRIGGGGG